VGFSPVSALILFYQGNHEQNVGKDRLSDSGGQKALAKSGAGLHPAKNETLYAFPAGNRLRHNKILRNGTLPNTLLDGAGSVHGYMQKVINTEKLE
jgi:hypothetical protein